MPHVLMLGNEPLFAIDYRVEGNALFRHYAKTKTIERIIPWGPDAGAWRTSAGNCLPFVPEIDLSLIEQIAWQPGGSRFPSWRRRAAACRFLVGCWPEDARDTVRPFPTAHWQLLQLLNTGGRLARELLQSNPALGFLAAEAGAANEVGLRRRKLAARFGFPETEHTVNLLRKVPIPWITPEFLTRLRTVMTEEPDVDAVITHLERINPITLEVLRDPEMKASVGRDCIRRLAQVLAPASQCDLIGRMRDLREYAHHHRLPLPRIRRVSDLDRPAPRLPLPEPEATEPTVDPTPALAAPDPDPRNLPEEHDDGMFEVSWEPYVFPDPPYPDHAVDGIRIEAIRNQQELIAESEAMHHCAGRDPFYAHSVSAGDFYFYRMIEPERLTIALRREGKFFVIDQVRGVCNRLPNEDTVRLIWNWIQQSIFRSLSNECVIVPTGDGPLPATHRVPITLRQRAAPVRRRLHSTDQLLFNFEQTE